MPDACREYVRSEQKSRPLKGPAFDGFESSNIITPTHTRARQSRSTSSFRCHRQERNSWKPDGEKKRYRERDIGRDRERKREREKQRGREKAREWEISREKERKRVMLCCSKKSTKPAGFSCTFTLLQPSALSSHIRDPFRLSKSFRKHGCTPSFFRYSLLPNRTNCLRTLLRYRDRSKSKRT